MTPALKCRPLRSQRGAILLEAIVSLGALGIGLICFLEVIRLISLKSMLFFASEDALRRLQEVHSAQHLWCQGSQQGLSQGLCTPCPTTLSYGACSGNGALNKMVKKRIAQKLTQVPTALLFHRRGQLESLPAPTPKDPSPFPMRVWLIKEKNPKTPFPQLRIKVVVCAPTLFSQLLLGGDRGTGGRGCRVAQEGDTGQDPGHDPTSPTGKRDGLGQFSQTVSPFSWKLTEHVERPLGTAHYTFRWGTETTDPTHPVSRLEKTLHRPLLQGNLSPFLSLENGPKDRHTP